MNETETEDITMSFEDEMEAEVLHSADKFLCNYAVNWYTKNFAMLHFQNLLLWDINIKG